MKTVFLSGFSDHNRDWMNSVINSIPSIGFQPINYPHWGKEVDFSSYLSNLDLDKYLSELLENTDPEINIISKSFGTLIASKIIQSKKYKVNKIIMCGLPLNMLRNYSSIYSALLDIPVNNLLLIQNEFDKYGPASEIRTQLMGMGINKELVINSQDSSHEYNNLQLFAQFINS